MDAIRDGYDELMSQSEEQASTAQETEDNVELNSVVSGEKELFIDGYGLVVFQQPTARLSLQGDSAAAKFRSKHLRHGDILTEAQLKLIYGRPTTVKIDGVETQIGNGSWTENNEQELENLPDQITRNMETVLSYRNDISEVLNELKVLPDGESEIREGLDKKLKELNDDAYPLYLQVLEDKKQLMELQLLRLQLFSISLEEQTNLEKIKIFAPACIKRKQEDGSIESLWKTEDDFLDDNVGAVHLLSVYNLFLRGVDISFFGDVPEEKMSSPDTNTQKSTDNPSS